MIATICVCGAGTMGSGIAQVAAQSGFETKLFDLNETALEKAKVGIEKNLQFLVNKNKISIEDKNEIFNRIHFIQESKDCVGSLIIEAIVEKPEAKISLFNEL